MVCQAEVLVIKRAQNSWQSSDWKIWTKIITLACVPEHIGIQGHETADEMAKKDKTSKTEIMPVRFTFVWLKPTSGESSCEDRSTDGERL